MRRYDLNNRNKDLDYHKGEYYQTVRYPKIERHETDIYVITVQGDRLDSLSWKYYGDTTFWWVIAKANNMGKGSLTLDAGKQIRIPQKLDKILSDFATMQRER